MEEIRSILERMGKEVPGFVACALVEKDEGLAIAEHRENPSFEVSVTAAYSVEMMRVHRRSLDTLSEKSERNDVVSISDKYYLFTRPVTDSNLYLHLIVSRDKGSLGILFAFLRKFDELVREAVSAWQKV